MPKTLILNENGFSSYNQRHYDTRLKLISMEQRTFETIHASQCRKVIQRFTRNMMLSDLNSKSIEKLKKSSRVLENVNPKELVITPKTDDTKASFSRYFESFPLLEETNLDFEDFEENQLFKTETPFLSRENTNIFAQREPLDLNDNAIFSSRINLLKPINNNAKSVKVNDQTVLLPEIFNQQTKMTQKLSRKFINTLGDEDSGFFYLTNAKGLPMYDGLDNYAHLQKSTPNKAKNRFENSEEDEIKKSEKNKWKNPFDRQTPLPVIIKKNKFEDNSEQDEEETTITGPGLALPNSATIFHQVLRQNMQKEEEKILKETFKAQNIRSLTMPSVDIY